MKTRVMHAIGMTSTDEETLVESWLNEGRDQLLIEAKLHVETATIDLTADVLNYELSTSVLAIERVIFNDDVDRPLERRTIDEILRARTFSSSVTWGWALRGTNLFMVAGTPQTGDQIDVYHVPQPSDMAADSDNASSLTFGGIRKDLHPGIVAYAKWKAADDDDDTSSQTGLVYKGEFDEWVKIAKNRRNRMGGPPARVRPGRGHARRIHR